MHHRIKDAGAPLRGKSLTRTRAIRKGILLSDNLTVSKTMLAACENCTGESCLGHLCKHFIRAVVLLHAFEKSGLCPEDVQALKAEIKNAP